MTAPTLTCGDLARLGLPGFAEHDPRAQEPADPHCHCWWEGPTVRDGGLTYGTAEYDEQPCEAMERWTGADGTVYGICCRCAEGIERRLDVERAAAGLHWQRPWSAENPAVSA